MNVQFIKPYHIFYMGKPYKFYGFGVVFLIFDEIVLFIDEQEGVIKMYGDRG